QSRRALDRDGPIERAVTDLDLLRIGPPQESVAFAAQGEARGEVRTRELHARPCRLLLDVAVDPDAQSGCSSVDRIDSALGLDQANLAGSVSQLGSPVPASLARDKTFRALRQ